MSLQELAKHNNAGNSLFGDVQIMASSNCYVRATAKHVSVIGVSDLIVVETEDAILIVHKDATQEVKSAADVFKRTRPKQAAQ